MPANYGTTTGPSGLDPRTASHHHLGGMSMTHQPQVATSLVTGSQRTTSIGQPIHFTEGDFQGQWIRAALFEVQGAAQGRK